MLILISGYNQRAVVAFLRALRKNHIEEYAILARDENDPILQTDYKSKVYYIRKNTPLNKKELYPIIEEISSLDSGDTVIVPSTEALNRFLVNNKMELEQRGVTVPLVDEQLYSAISDKRSFWEMCFSAGLKVPRIIQISDDFECKYVAKPKTYISASGQRLVPIIVNSPEDHRDFIDCYDLNDFDIQEFVTGESYYLLYYLSRAGHNYAFSQRNLAQQPGGKSIVAAIPSEIHNNQISAQYIDLLRSKNFYGFAMIELRKKDGDYYMIEANPRMWGPTQLYVDSHVPFIEAFLNDYGFLEDIPQESIDPNAAYYWSGGVKDFILEDKDCVWLDGGKVIFEKDKERFLHYDIYDREDTSSILKLEKDFWKGKN